jgi:tRNA A37 threonylcarbamoyladenosine synthetase subunit TsaC/SUA5/YrdC
MMTQQNNIPPKQYATAIQNSHIVFCTFDNMDGLLCDAANEDMVKDLVSKIHPPFMYLLVDNAVKLRSIVPEIPEIAYDLYETSDNTMFIVFSELQNVCTTVQQHISKVRVGVATEDFITKIIQQYRRPILFIPCTTQTKELVSQLKQNFPYLEVLSPKNGKINAGYGIIKLEKDGTFVLLRK